MLQVCPLRMVLSLRVSLHQTCDGCSVVSRRGGRGTDGDIAVRPAAEEMIWACGDAEDGVALLAEAVEETWRPLSGVERATERCWVAVDVSGVGCEDTHEGTYGEERPGWGLDVLAFEEEEDRAGRMKGDGLGDDGTNDSGLWTSRPSRQARDSCSSSRHPRASLHLQIAFVILSSAWHNPTTRHERTRKRVLTHIPQLITEFDSVCAPLRSIYTSSASATLIPNASINYKLLYL